MGIYDPNFMVPESVGVEIMFRLYSSSESIIEIDETGFSVFNSSETLANTRSLFRKNFCLNLSGCHDMVVGAKLKDSVREFFTYDLFQNGLAAGLEQNNADAQVKRLGSENCTICEQFPLFSAIDRNTRISDILITLFGVSGTGVLEQGTPQYQALC